MSPTVPRSFPSDDELKMLHAQVEEAVPWRDGVLTCEQARWLLHEVQRLRALASEKDVLIASLSRRNERLMGVLS